MDIEFPGGPAPLIPRGSLRSGLRIYGFARSKFRLPNQVQSHEGRRPGDIRAPKRNEPGQILSRKCNYNSLNRITSCDSLAEEPGSAVECTRTLLVATVHTVVGKSLAENVLPSVVSSATELAEYVQMTRITKRQPKCRLCRN
jgi:hypothetical protein